MIGADRAGRTVVIPDDKYDDQGNLVKADDAGRQAFYAKIGVPAKAEDYNLPVPADNPYPEFKTLMQSVFHENGVSSRQALAISKGWEGALGKMEEAIRAREDAQSNLEMAELERAWGANYQERLAIGARGRAWLSEQLGGLTDVQQRQLESLLGTTKFMTMMWKFGAGNKEISTAGGDAQKGGGFAPSASDAQRELDQIRADRQNGKISDYEWRDLDKPDGKIAQLTKTIIAGMAAAGNA